MGHIELTEWQKWFITNTCPHPLELIDLIERTHGLLTKTVTVEGVIEDGRQAPTGQA